MSLYGETQSVRVLSTCEGGMGGGWGTWGMGDMGGGGLVPTESACLKLETCLPHGGGGSPQRLKEEIFTSMFKSQA